MKNFPATYLVVLVIIIAACRWSGFITYDTALICILLATISAFLSAILRRIDKE